MSHYVKLYLNNQILCWKYHKLLKQPDSEIAMQRYKKIVGPKMHARKMENQTQEMMIACGVLNRFTGLGMLQSFRTA